MAEQRLITCPECQTEFPIDEALKSQILEELKKEMEKKFREKEIDISEKIRKEIQAKHSVETEDLTERLKEQTETIKKLEKAELNKRKAERQLNEFQEKFNQQLEIETEKIQGETRKNLKEIKDKYNFEKEKELGEKQSELIALSDQLRDAKNKRNELQNKVLEEQNNVKEKEIELQKEFLSKKEQWRKEVSQQAQNEYKLKLDESNKKIDGLTKTITALKAEAEQGSQQIQGEVLEDNLKSILEENFPEDIIEDVPTGIMGADIVQKITYPHGNTCGILLWECKNTGNWSKGWIEKLKSDLKAINGNFPILVSKTLPREITSFGEVKNVWVTRMDLVVPLAKILREAVIALYQKDKSLEGTEIKTERLYKFLTSSRFKNMVVDSLDSFLLMTEVLEKEKKTTKKRWKKQELLIEGVQNNIVNMYGSFEGILGRSIQELEEVSDHLLIPNDEDDDIEDLEDQ